MTIQLMSIPFNCIAAQNGHHGRNTLQRPGAYRPWPRELPLNIRRRVRSCIRKCIESSVATKQAFLTIARLMISSISERTTLMLFPTTNHSVQATI